MTDEWKLFAKDGVLYFHCPKAAYRYAEQHEAEVIIRDFNNIRYFGVKE